ncbi:MAG: HAD family hydrolase [Bdellovibrionales bacterium]|nr:HAD family hydrolase [Bdellovibrionales bacterium]
MRALIFDFDGTLVDTESAAFKCWSEVYARHGATLDPYDWIRAVGTYNGFDPHAHLERLTGLNLDREIIQSEYRPRKHELVTALPALPGVLPLLRAARARGLRTAIASSSERAWIDQFLNRLELHEYFDAICTRDDVEQVKPNPALYLLALERLGVNAHEAIAFEDSRNGLLAARAAGIFTVVVPNSVTKISDFSPAQLRLESLADKTLAELRGHHSDHSSTK